MKRRVLGVKILVCIKQVPNQDAKYAINADNNGIIYDDNTAYWINMYDEHAIEAALQIKESIANSSIDILSIGPKRVEAAIRRSLEMGADYGYRLVYEGGITLSPSIKSQMIAEFCEGREYDLIITGVMSEDMMSGQVGPMLAARLDIPSATAVMQFIINTENNSIWLERELDGGLRGSLELKLPVLITVQSGINRPRYPSFSNVMRAKKSEIIEVATSTHLHNLQYERLVDIPEPEVGRQGIKLTGSLSEKAQALWELLHGKSLI